MEILNGHRVDGLMMFNVGDTLHVHVSVDPRREKSPEIRITTKDIIHFLNEKNIKYSECIKSSVVSNTSEARFGTWIFSVPNKEISTPATLNMLTDKIRKEIEEELDKELFDSSNEKLDTDISSDVMSDKPKRKKVKKDTDSDNA